MVIGLILIVQTDIHCEEAEIIVINPGIENAKIPWACATPELPRVTPELADVRVESPHVTVELADVRVECPHVTPELPHVRVECPHVTPELAHATVECPHVRVECPHVTVEYAHVKPPYDKINNNFKTANFLEGISKHKSKINNPWRYS